MSEANEGRGSSARFVEDVKCIEPSAVLRWIPERLAGLPFEDDEEYRATPARS
jgi:hypothetical protein